MASYQPLNVAFLWVVPFQALALALLWRGRLGLAGTLAVLPIVVTMRYWAVAPVLIATNSD